MEAQRSETLGLPDLASDSAQPPIPMLTRRAWYLPEFVGPRLAIFSLAYADPYPDPAPNTAVVVSVTEQDKEYP